MPCFQAVGISGSELGSCPGDWHRPAEHTRSHPSDLKDTAGTVSECSTAGTHPIRPAYTGSRPAESSEVALASSALCSC